MPEKPVIYQGGQAGNDLYAGQSFPGYFPDPFAAFPFVSAGDTSQFAGVDPVIDTVANPHGGVQTEYKTVSGATPLQITDAVKNQIYNLMTNIKPVQDLHGYDSPWPAGGGKNLYNVDNKTVSAANTILEMDVAQNTDYTFSVDITQTALYVAYYDNGTWTTLTTKYTTTFITFNSGVYTKIRLTTYSGINELPTKFQLELGTIATSWEPYANICPITGWTGCNVYISPTTNPADATVYPCAWQDEAGTVYGGRIDVATGWMEVTYIGLQLTINRAYWSNSTFTTISYPSDAASDVRGSTISSHFSRHIGGWAGLAVGQFQAFGGIIGANIPDVYDPATMRAYITAQEAAGTPIWYVIHVEPRYYQVPAVNMFTLDGTNHIWTNCGDNVSVTYAAVK